MPMAIILLLVSINLNHVVNSKEGDSGLSGGLQGLDFRHGRFQDSLLEVISNDAVDEVKAGPLEGSLGVTFGSALSRVVVSS